MKKTLTTTAAMALACVSLPSYAVETTVIATMEQLVQSGTIGTGVTKSTAYSENDTVYTFTGEGAILNITNATLQQMFEERPNENILIAAWVSPGALPSGHEVLSIFSNGGQSNGIKFGVTSGGLRVTTKGSTDKSCDFSGIDRNGGWTLVAVSFNLNTMDGRFNATTTSGQFSSVNFGTLGAADPDAFAIGAGNADLTNGLREGYVGSIANLTVFKSSSSTLTGEEIYAALGAAPTLAPVPVPEPATATLSLLAFAGLAARRRRK